MNVRLNRGRKREIGSSVVFQIVCDKTLPAHWPVDETEGDIAYDSAGVNYAVLKGNPPWDRRQGIVGSAPWFDSME